MAPFADFLFFGLSLYIVLPTILLGLFGFANKAWTTIASLAFLALIYSGKLEVAPEREWPFLAVVAVFGLYQLLVALALLRWRTRWTFYASVGLAILPLAANKFLPLIEPDNVFGFIGISYITFRALDVLFSVYDRILTTLAPGQYLAFLFFFPTVSSGPIDRYRRFGQDWNRQRSRADFLDDLDAAVQRIFQGFLYKFLIAALLRTYWMDPIAKQTGFLGACNYMYAYTFYLFFDFAGYSAFAIGFSRLFGIRSPENFNLPFLARNIRDFWTRWHISLPYWFRDHVYMRFLLTAAKGKWFKGKHTSSYLGLFLTFGLMGIWHGLESYYLLYGLYHALLLSGYDWFARWNKTAKFWLDGHFWRGLNIVLTFHAIAFGLLLFSGHLFPRPVPAREEVADRVDCELITGWVWNKKDPNGVASVDIYVDEAYLGRVPANEFRADLKERGYGNGQHGFTWKMPEWIRNGHTHPVEVKVVETGRTLRGTPVDISCPAP